VVAVLAAILARAVAALGEHPDRARAAIGAVGTFAVLVVVWTAVGPLGSEWARRSGTPTALLGHAHKTRVAAGARR
jgi:hypothetical protein